MAFVRCVSEIPRRFRVGGLAVDFHQPAEAFLAQYQMPSDAAGLRPREPAEPEMAQLRIRAVIAHLSCEWRGTAISLKIVALPDPPRQPCSFPAVRPISFSMEPATSCRIVHLLSLQVFGGLFAFLRRRPPPEDGHGRAARREAEWNRGRRAMPVAPEPRFTWASGGAPRVWLALPVCALCLRPSPRA